MSATVFRNQEQQYLRWLSKSTEGFVLTTAHDAPTNYMVLHRSICRKISVRNKNMIGHVFTGKHYMKICADDPVDLIDWIRQQGGSGFTKQCSICKPDLPAGNLQSQRALIAEFENQVQAARKDAAARRARLKEAPKQPRRILTITTMFSRNPDVVAEVLDRAAGRCEICGNPAPFLKAGDKTPYLEVHHKKTLGSGGDDTVDNAVAACPNCHREAHYG